MGPIATAKLVMGLVVLTLVHASAACGEGSPSSRESTGDATGGNESSTVAMSTVCDTSGDVTGSSTSTGGASAGSESSTGATLPDEDDLPLALGLRVCALVQACGCPNYDPAKCVAQLEVRFADWQAQAIAAGFAFDAACWAQTVEVLDKQQCGVVDRIDCSIYHGDAQRGEVCERFGPWMNACAPPLSCPYEGAPCIPLGGEPTLLDLGEPCFDPATGTLLGVCDPRQSLECDFEAFVCVALPGVGLPCERGECTDGAWCDELDDDGPVCKPQVAPGAPCSVAEACMSSLCAEGTCLDLLDPSCFFVPPWEPN